MKTHADVLALAAFVLMPAARAAQTPRLAVTPYGMSIASVGDLDGDGVGDLVAGAIGVTKLMVLPGSVAAISGRDGRVLHGYGWIHPQGAVPLTTPWPSVSAVGDVNADGRPDFAFTSTLQGNVAIVSGAGGELIANVVGNLHDGIGDADGDGIDDFATGYQDVLRIFSGKDQSLLHQIPHPPTGLQDHALKRLGRAGDVDGDGRGDVVISGTILEGAVYFLALRVYSGATGALLLERKDPGYFGSFPGATVPAGDVNADGHGDLLTAIDDEELPFEGILVSGADGAVLASFDDPELVAGAQTAAALDDLDRDGVNDIALGARVSSALDFPGRITIFSGADGHILARTKGPLPSTSFPSALVATGDLDGDGVRDFVAGASNSSGSGVMPQGLLVYSAASLPAEVFGACYSTYQFQAPCLSVTGSLKPGTAMTLRIVSGVPGALVTLAGSTTMPPLYSLPLADLAAPILLDSAGAASLGVRWPSGVPAGFTLYVAALAPPVGPPNSQPSNILRLTAP
jgi:hypothetical protein